MYRADRMRLPKAQRPQLCRISLTAFIVNLVGRQEDWLTRALQQLRSRLFDRLGDLFRAELPFAFVVPGAFTHRDAPARCLTSSSRCAITCDSVMTLVSTTSASSAARNGETARVESK